MRPSQKRPKRMPAADDPNATKPRYKERHNKLPAVVWNEGTKKQVEKLARSGLSDKEIAAAIGLDKSAWDRWLKSPSFRQVLQDARTAVVGQRFWEKYLVGRLTPTAKACWDRIMGAKGDRLQLAARILGNRGVRVRQELFLASLVHFNFRLQAACDFVGVRRSEVESWVRNDPGFAELMAEIREAKKDFFEAALIELVEDRNPAAVLFAAKTQLADRGYNPKKQVEISGTVGHDHSGTVTVEQLDTLSVAARRELLAALQEKRGVPRLAAAEDVRTVIPPDDPKEEDEK